MILCHIGQKLSIDPELSLKNKKPPINIRVLKEIERIIVYLVYLMVIRLNSIIPLLLNLDLATLA